MYIHPGLAVSFATYPSPPSLASSDVSYDDLYNMGANTNVNIDGIGVLNYQRAIDIARNSEGELDPTVSAYLEGALTDIWSRVSIQPDDYVMTKDEFAVFNYYRRRFDENTVAENAVARYWANTYDNPAATT
ncbi:hypothetical protein Slin15195_G121150 [Septoria linicola]|uniref:Uncharacterized protein n=1 Tax=Septoria linicola TaxID=215465 RepID=A0A9Q9B9G1_9PEZI|nr:hypothetical protein Slin14017_G098150 [Septoria linicola]USW58796.1 hypothetical protein Slin15195_G121150 [Septoria linicola]